MEDNNTNIINFKKFMRFLIIVFLLIGAFIFASNKYEEYKEAQRQKEILKRQDEMVKKLFYEFNILDGELSALLNCSPKSYLHRFANVQEFKDNFTVAKTSNDNLIQTIYDNEDIVKGDTFTELFLMYDEYFEYANKVLDNYGATVMYLEIYPQLAQFVSNEPSLTDPYLRNYVPYWNDYLDSMGKCVTLKVKIINWSNGFLGEDLIANDKKINEEKNNGVYDEEEQIKLEEEMGPPPDDANANDNFDPGGSVKGDDYGKDFEDEDDNFDPGGSVKADDYGKDFEDENDEP